jgi:regulator of protease activity HflC (stomatin/prohibitin superfamily)
MPRPRQGIESDKGVLPAMETLFTILIIFFAALVILFLSKAVVIVQQSERVVIERLGGFHAILDPGINLIIPLMDKPRSIKIRRHREAGRIGAKELVPQMVEESRIDVRETVLDFPGQPMITADNVSVRINGALYFQIIDPKKAVYEVENFMQAIEVLAKTSLRSEVGKMELDKLFESRAEINERLAMVMDEAGDKWGVKVNRVEIQDIEVPKDIEEAMHKQMSAERARRAMVTEANGQRAAEIARAEGEKQAAILRAEGQRQAIQQVLSAAEGSDLKATDVVSYLTALQYMEVLPHIAKQGERVFLPYEATSLMATVEAIRNIMPVGKTADR